jgi:mono/diheme cytochrome c family protein
MTCVHRSSNFVFAIVTTLQAATWSGPASAAQPVSFSLDVLPILASHCVKCHQPGGPGYEASGLDLRTYDSLMQGTKHGKIVVPGEPLTSNLMVMVEGRADPSIRMPHNQRPLLKQQIEIMRDWVSQGAKNN